MIKRLLASVIIFLFFGASVVSSINIVENEYSTKELLSRGKTAYAYIAYPGSSGLPEGPCYFDLDNPGTLTSFAIENCPGFLCGAWTLDQKWLVCDENGSLWEIDLCDMTASEIGGGGTVFYGLTYNPANEKLYGSTLDDLYEIDIDTGNPTYIGDFGISTYMIDIACDIDGVCYGWDILFSGNSKLYTIDLDDGQASEIADLGWAFTCVSSGSFDYETNTLYIAACCSSCGFLIIVDFENCEFSQIGNFQGCAYIGSLVIPYTDDFCPPVTTHSLDPPEPDGCNGWYVSNVTVMLNATDDSGVKETYYSINGLDWKIYESPFVITEEGDDILIWYYSVDYFGNNENLKSATLDIDQTTPDIDLIYEITGGNPIEGWNFLFIAIATDIISGMDRVEFYLNDAEQSVVFGSGPIYEWIYKFHLDPNMVVKAVGYDTAGNSDYDKIVCRNKEIIIQKSIHNLLLRLLERFLLLEQLLNVFFTQ